jgi:hypothetical protein
MLRPNNIVLPISGNRYVSISQNRKGNDYEKKGIVYGNYAERVEIAILNSNFEIINDAFDYGVKGFLETKDLINELSKLTERT